MAGSVPSSRGTWNAARHSKTEHGTARALFMIDPDGNETEINTRYLYAVPQR